MVLFRVWFLSLSILCVMAQSPARLSQAATPRMFWHVSAEPAVASPGVWPRVTFRGSSARPCPAGLSCVSLPPAEGRSQVQLVCKCKRLNVAPGPEGGPVPSSLRASAAGEKVMMPGAKFWEAAPSRCWSLPASSTWKTGRQRRVDEVPLKHGPCPCMCVCMRVCSGGVGDPDEPHPPTLQS